MGTDRLTPLRTSTQYRLSAVSAAAVPPPEEQGRTPRPPARIWLYRLVAAVGIPAALLLCIEGSLRLAGYGQSVAFLIPDEKPGYFRTNPEFVTSFLPSSFDLRPLNFRISATKPPNSVRIVVLGESAAQGIPVPSFGFAPQLRALLRAKYPGTEFEVINTGIVAINSHVVYKIARELAGYSPDLFVIYMGNNEVVGPYGPGCAYLSQMPPLWFIRLSVFVKSTRTGQLFAAALGRLPRAARQPAEWGGMAMFANNAVSGDDPRLKAVYRNFESNLREIVRVAQDAGAKTLLCTVASNLKDCAPLLSVHRTGLTARELAQWGVSFRRGRTEWLLGDTDRARADLLDAERIDPHYADSAFMLGSIELGAGHLDGARHHFVDAEHWDALRFRPDPRINEVVREVAREGGPAVSLVDVAGVLGSDPESRGMPAGREQFFEHVHFNWDGNFAVAQMLAGAAQRSLYGNKTPSGPWLDSAGCAAAVGYTEHEQLNVLQKVEGIVENPPFTNRITYCEDMATLARDLAKARSNHWDPGKTGLAKSVVEGAAARDPLDADLARLESEIDDDLGDLDGALAQSQRAQDLQPVSYALVADEAIKLSRLGRYGPAEELLDKAATKCPPRDLALMAPAFADLYVRSGRFAEGRRYLDSEIAQRPTDKGLRLTLARLLALGGDTEGAGSELRLILEADPGNQAALEQLVDLLGRARKASEVEDVCLKAVEHQPGNQPNNLRAAIIYDMRHDDERSSRCLIAAEHSGSVTSGLEANLARRLLRLGRPDDALEHLALARRISIIEGDTAATDRITHSIDRVISEAR